MSSPETVSDQELPQIDGDDRMLERARSGEPRAWEELLARFGAVVTATGRRCQLSPSDVAQLQQTTWLRLVENLHQIDQPDLLGRWITATALREGLRLSRRSLKRHAAAR
jgi:DNA-directed RNA polymerase specialized sigma24 family protein